MRLVFMGTPDFAAVILQKLIDSGESVEAVFTQPDKPVGRKHILTPPQVKVCAQKYGIAIYQPEKLKNSNVADIIRNINPDAVIVAAYGKILPNNILASAKYGCINVHASLLPEYRGAAPIQHCILNGDSETGVTIMQMDEGIDTGDIILQEKTSVGINETSAELFDRLAVLGADALIKALELIKSGRAVKRKQPNGDFTYASMISKELCPIDWNKTAFEVHNKVRGLQTWPVATTKINGLNVKIHKTQLVDGFSGAPGEVVLNRKRLIVACGDSKCVEILKIQPEGKKIMDTQAFLSGYEVSSVEHF